MAVAAGSSLQSHTLSIRPLATPRSSPSHTARPPLASYTNSSSQRHHRLPLIPSDTLLLIGVVPQSEFPHKNQHLVSPTSHRRCRMEEAEVGGIVTAFGD
ncbi:hypothetical protein ACQJBY_037134 [Aegilops geniculata]